MKQIVMIIALLLSVTASAQQRYTLDQCRNLALAHNARLKMAENDVMAATQGEKKP